MFTRTPSKGRGFTLVELMIVVAIIGILVSVAVPNFVQMQFRAKRAEVPVNVESIKTAEEGYAAAFDTYLAATPFPASTPGKKQRDWGGGSAEFQQLGWAPDGAVRGTYEVLTGGGAAAGDFMVRGWCDVDGEGNVALYTATRSTKSSFQNNADTY